ncbi:hypothetical protein BD626DRAFT_550077 [Schizophyllum amplum]|uniref:DUF6534 domain-containing protein n=1 Tax=Schizophyllum amplum TaxID=97359 RepID=A0A550C553_9AGAR|nr:hypothetical protein BD626DRAFT_550077 [Auriculariopsis ampla]
MVATVDNTRIAPGLASLSLYARKDHWIYNVLVVVVLSFDTVQQGLYAVYWYCVTNNGNPAALAILDPTLAYHVLFIGLLAFITQMFYCHRVYRLSHKNYYATGVLVAASLAAFMYTARCARYGFFADLAALKDINVAINVISAVTDVLISISMILCLQQSKTGFKRSNDILNRLIVFTFNTGLPTSFAAIWSLISVRRQWPSHIALLTVLVDQLTNCLLVTLNSRMSIQESLNGQSDSYALSSRDQRSGNRNTTNPGAIAVRIDTAHQMDRPLEDYKQHPNESQSFKE